MGGGWEGHATQSCHHTLAANSNYCDIIISIHVYIRSECNINIETQNNHMDNHSEHEHSRALIPSWMT